jgi:hypothetical protein
VAALVLALVGCGDDQRLPPGHKGELENGTFSYRCADATDRFCDSDAFPTTIALGSLFGVDYEYFQGVERPTPSLVPAAAGLSTQDPDLFRVEQESPTAILCIIEGDEVVDFFHVTGESVSSLAIYETIGDNETGTIAIELTPGESRSLRASAVDASATPLAGALEYEWTVADSAVATLAPDPSGTHRTIITAEGALGEQTSLEVAAAGLTLAVDVSIGESGDTGDGDDGGTTGATGSTSHTTDASGTATTGDTGTTATGGTSTS